MTNVTEKCKITALENEIERLRKTLAFYLGEGQPRYPAEKRWIELVAIPIEKRTQYEKVALKNVARVLANVASYDKFAWIFYHAFEQKEHHKKALSERSKEELLSGLMVEVGELSRSMLCGDSQYPTEFSLRQIAAIILNWLEEIATLKEVIE